MQSSPVALFSKVIYYEMETHGHPFLDHQMIEGQSTKLAGITISTTFSAEVQTAIKGAIDASFVSAFRLVSLLSAAMALLSAVGAGWLIEGKQPERAESSASEPQAAPVRADRQAPQSSAN